MVDEPNIPSSDPTIADLQAQVRALNLRIDRMEEENRMPEPGMDIGSDFLRRQPLIIGGDGIATEQIGDTTVIMADPKNEPQPLFLPPVIPDGTYEGHELLLWDWDATTKGWTVLAWGTDAYKVLSIDAVNETVKWDWVRLRGDVV